MRRPREKRRLSRTGEEEEETFCHRLRRPGRGFGREGWNEWLLFTQDIEWNAHHLSVLPLVPVDPWLSTRRRRWLTRWDRSAILDCPGKDEDPPLFALSTPFLLSLMGMGSMEDSTDRPTDRTRTASIQHPASRRRMHATQRLLLYGVFVFQCNNQVSHRLPFLAIRENVVRLLSFWAPR
jgi:hypothetical protein